jgi:hypothetical protein
LSLVVVCDDGPLLLHWTVVPTLTDSMAGEKEKSWIVTQAPVQRGDVVLSLQPNRTTKPAHMLTTVARQSANVGIRMVADLRDGFETGLLRGSLKHT